MRSEHILTLHYKGSMAAKRASGFSVTQFEALQSHKETLVWAAFLR